LCVRPCTICCKVFKQIGDRITLGLQRSCSKRIASRGLRVDAGCVVNEVGVKATFLDLFRGQIAGQLVNNGRNHLLVRKFLRSDIGKDSLANGIRHGISLIHITRSRAHFTIRAAQLSDDELCHCRIGGFDLDGIL